MSKKALIVFLRNPVSGKVKTRIASEVGNDKALTIYLKLMQKAIRQSLNAKADTFLFYSEEAITKYVNQVQGIYVQTGQNLGERMKNAFNICFELGYERVALIGSDCWELEVSDIDQALDALDKNQVVLGPAFDGGYYCIALSDCYEIVFDQIAWGSEKVYAQTLAKIAAYKLKLSILEQRHDVDTWQDVKRYPELLKDDE